MYSAGVNAALTEFFNIADIEAGNIPPSGNIPGNIPDSSASNIPTEDNIPFKDNISLDIGNILPGVITYLVALLVTYRLTLVTYHLKAL